METKGRLFILSGPSGCGKSTVLREVFQRRDRLYFSVSATTREPRPGERDGIDYYFLTREVFDQMVRDGELLEHAEYVRNCYGTPARPIMDKLEEGIDVVLDIDVQGARQVKAKLPEAVSVFISPPSLAELERRLRGRSTESEDKITQRLQTAAKELSAQSEYDFVIVNDQVDRAADELLSIMANRESANTSL